MFRALIERRLPSALYRGGERHIRRGNELHCLVGFKRVSSCCQRGRALSVMCLTLLSTSPRMDPPDQLRTALRRPKWQKQTQSEDPERARAEREAHLLFSEFRLANPSVEWACASSCASSRSGNGNAPRRAPDMPRQGAAASGCSPRLSKAPLLHASLGCCGVARVLSLALTRTRPRDCPGSTGSSCRSQT